MCKNCEENKKMLEDIKKERDFDNKQKKERYTFFSGGIHGEAYVLDNKTGKKENIRSFLSS